MAMNEYEQETTELFSDCVETGMSILDIGAHVGYYSLLAAKLAGPTGKVISFEPDPDNYSLLLRNIEENGYTNITAVNQGITSTTGVGTLILSGLDNGRHSIYHHGLPEKGSVSISTTSVDDYFGALGWPTVDLIKMDVEGAELEVLLGMTGLLDRSHNIKLIMELNPVLLKNADVEPKSLLTRIESLGLTLHQVRSGVAPQRLQSSEMGPLIDRLFSSQDSINLYCTKE
jgi:FkbM family methyltransferase